MNIAFYILIFIIGVTFGSFFTLAVYRIPRGEDITHTRSYCPNCSHKLSFFDMIPVLSYIFLGGKCRYCHRKIRIRYLLLEILSGIAFVIFAVSIKLDLLNLNKSLIVYYIFSLLYITGLFLIGGIDYEKKELRNDVLLYTVIIEVLYIIYLYIFESINIYRYVIYLFLLIILIVINNVYFKKKLKNNYTIQILMLILIISIYTYEYCAFLSIIFTLLSIGITLVIKMIKNKKRKSVKIEKTENNIRKVPIGFYLCVGNILIMIIINGMIFYR